MGLWGRSWWAVAGWLVAAIAGADEATLPAPIDRPIDFQTDVRPLLEQHCLDCHGPDTQESNLRIDRRSSLLSGGDRGEPAVVPGNSGESLLIKAVAHMSDDLEMPPDSEPLAPDQIAILRAWIDQDLPGLAHDTATSGPVTDHWSFQPITRPPLPTPKTNVDWPANPIDVFVLQRLEQAGLNPSSEADRRTLLRRLYLDNLGLAPTREQRAHFEADPRPDAYERAVDRVLASPRYGERWARHWLDVVRFAETNGFETNTPRPNAFHYRDYVIRAWNEDKPFDRFVFEQIAGDSVGEDAATGFLVAGSYDEVKSPDIVLTLMQRQDELADMINVTGGAFLGLTLGCARCHNHKFDPVRQSDFYSLQAVFAGVKHGERPLLDPEARKDEEEAARLRARLADIHEQLESFGSTSSPVDARQTVAIDDEETSGRVAVEYLLPPAGNGQNPDGAARGYRDDPGDFQRLPNISRGRYTWWQSDPGVALAAYRPHVAGEYGVWLSWGCGWTTHAKDAEYWLDTDGDVNTASDQRLIARIDQQRFADGSQTPNGIPLWSGLAYVGVHSFDEPTCIILRSGSEAAAVTADLVVLAPFGAAARSAGGARLPPLAAKVTAQQNTDEFGPVPARWLRFSILDTNQSEPCIDELEVYSTDGRNVAAASCGATVLSSGDYQGNPKHQLEHIHDGRYGNSYSWISNQDGAGWIELEFAEPIEIERVVWGRDRLAEYNDRVPTRYSIEVAVEPGRWQQVAGSHQRLPFELAESNPLAFRFGGLADDQKQTIQLLLGQVEDLNARIQLLTQDRKLVYAGVFEQPSATHRLYRGDPMQQREQVPPDALPVIGSLSLSIDAPEQQRRQALAEWLSAAENPLTARVIVNRLWHYHFGTGIVATPSDFGGNGAPPSHPELLDWLASELIANNWSIKHVQKLILTSSTYRQSARSRDEAARIDAQARLLWRYPARRLEAEAIRDSILQASGSLDLRMYGRGYDVFQPNDNYVRVYVPKETLGPAEWRRMVYMTKVRMEQDPVFGTFDCPDSGQAAPVRPRSTTAIQALNLFNSPFVHEHAARMAERIERDVAADVSAQVTRAFQMTLGRDPQPAELKTCMATAELHGLASVCRALLNCNEFLFLP